MKYQQTIDYMYTHLPSYQRIGWNALKKDLNNTMAICQYLGNPHKKFPTIHIAGTNGKGSSAHWIASILQCAGYKTGLYTSPHLKNFTERIKIDGEEITKQAVVDFIKRLKPLISEIQPSFFEITVTMAFAFFASKKVDIAVIETGLGGRLDSTNVINPKLCLITNISYDHTHILGNTLSQIAKEKAGIIKLKTPVVISETQEEVKEIFCYEAEKKQAPIYFADKFIEVNKLENGKFSFLRKNTCMLNDICPGLKGMYQLKNLKGVLQSIEILKKDFGFTISKYHIKEGVEKVTQLTGIKGRWYVLGNKPLQICDVAHNPAGLKEVFKLINNLTYQKLYIILGVLKDKNLNAIFNILPRNAYYFFCAPKLPRALDADTLYIKAINYGLHGQKLEDVNQALNIAKYHASSNDLIFIGGSTFVVADIENL